MEAGAEMENVIPMMYVLVLTQLLVFAIKIIQPIIPSNLKKAKFIRASL